MVKEINNTSHPKAVNIVRPTHSLSVKRSTQIVPSSFTIIPNNKPKVARSAKVDVEDSHYTTKKTQLNIYHPAPKRLQSQKPAILSDAQRQQQQPKIRSQVIAPAVSAATGNSKPLFEIYKPPIKQTLSRSRTTPVMPSATLSTPISMSDNIYRQQQQQHQKRPTSQKTATVTTSSSSTLARSVTHHFLATSTTSSPYTDNSSCISSSNEDDFEYEYSKMKIGKHQILSRSDADTVVTDIVASESKKEKNANSSDEDEEGDGEDLVINEARVNRKIADLEISNRSLLAVNEMLEMTVRRQALQMAHLNKQKMAQDAPTGVKPLSPPIEQNESDSDEEWEKDNMFHRICQLTEKMIKSGEASLQYECKPLGGRVLSHYKEAKEEENDNAEEEHKEADGEGDGDALSQNIQEMTLAKESLTKEYDELIQQEEKYPSRTHTHNINSFRPRMY